jgi:hypothetical protein
LDFHEKGLEQSWDLSGLRQMPMEKHSQSSKRAKKKGKERKNKLIRIIKGNVDLMSDYNGKVVKNVHVESLPVTL